MGAYSFWSSLGTYPDTAESAILCAGSAGYKISPKTRATPAVERGVWIVGPVRLKNGEGTRDIELEVSLGGHGSRSLFRENLVDMLE